MPTVDIHTSLLRIWLRSIQPVPSWLAFLQSNENNIESLLGKHGQVVSMVPLFARHGAQADRSAYCSIVFCN